MELLVTALDNIRHNLELLATLPGPRQTGAFTIAINLIALTPVKGPTGTVVTIIGYGFTPDTTVDVTIGTPSSADW